MAFNHFLRNSRQVRLGGWRIFGRQFGGGWYTLEPLTVIRFVNLVEAVNESARPVKDKPGYLFASLPADVLRVLTKIFITEPIKPRHARRMSDRQVIATFDTATEVTDLQYCLRGLQPSPADGAGASERVGIEAVAVAIAQRFSIDDPYKVLRWPMQQLLAVCDLLKEQDQEPEPKPDRPHQVDDLAVDLKRLGIVVS